MDTCQFKTEVNNMRIKATMFIQLKDENVRYCCGLFATYSTPKHSVSYSKSEANSGLHQG